MRRPPLALLASLALASCARTDPQNLDFALEHSWPTSPALPPLGSGRIVVTNSMDDTVSLLPLDTLGAPGWGELARLPVGLNPVELEGPHHAAFSPQGDYYYVGLSLSVAGAGSGPHGAHGTGTADGYALKLDASNNRLVGSVRVDRNPGDLVLSADGRTLYQSHFDLKRIEEVARGEGSLEEKLPKMATTLAVIDADTLKLKKKVTVCPAPHAVRLSPDESRAYVACISDEVAVVRLDDPTYPVLPPVKLPGGNANPVTPRYSPYALTLSPTDGGLWVSTLNTSTVFYLDPGTLQIRSERSLTLSEFENEDLRRGIPMFGGVSADGRTLYMPFQRVDTVAIIDVSGTRPVVRGRIPLAEAGCLNVHQVELTPDGAHALAVCEGDHVGPGTLHVLDLAVGRVVSTVEVGIYPDSVGILRRKP